MIILINLLRLNKLAILNQLLKQNFMETELDIKKKTNHSDENVNDSKSEGESRWSKLKKNVKSKKTMKSNRIFNALLQTLLILLGNTIGIVLSYFLIKFVLAGVIVSLKWPGIISFIKNGSFILIAFSNITTIIVATSSGLRINKHNFSAFLLLVVSLFIYIRCIGLGNLGGIDVFWGIIPFVFSSIMLFFAFVDQHNIFRKTFWLYKSKSDSSFDIFLSFAIAGNNSKVKRNVVEDYVNRLDSLLRECGYNSIFNASKYFEPSHEKQQPVDAAIEDFAAVENSKNFILLYPEKTPTSALMELGYALRDKRNILIISKDEHTLPFLARGMAEAHGNVRTIYFGDDFNSCLKEIECKHESYFK